MSDYKTPKLILKVDFLENFNVKFTLMSLHPYYNKHIYGNKIHTIKDNDFIIFEDDDFKIEDGLISLPDKNCKSVSNSTIKFINDKRRHETLLELKNALLDWSNSKYWSNSNIFNNEPKIIFKNKIWFLY